MVEPGEVKKEIAGLVANKLMSKYQRPCCVLTRGDGVYAGSARGYNKTGLLSFKDFCDTVEGVTFTAGHDNAFGIGIRADSISHFVEEANKQLPDISNEQIHYVDFIWDASRINGQDVIDIAELNDYIGTGFDRPYVFIKNIKVSADNIAVFKGNTLKYTLPAVDIIQFGATEEEIDNFKGNGYVTINAVCKCSINKWNGEMNPQLQMVEYEIVSSFAWDF